MRLVLTLLMVSCCYVAGCPSSCSCHHDKGLYVANCPEIPASAGRVEVLNVMPPRQWGRPQELIDGQFNQASHLKYLRLRNNSIYFIHRKAFFGAKGLIEIDLSFNYIEELDPMLFQHLNSLTTLKIRGNPLQLVSEEPFVISNTIQDLDIGQCKLKSIPRGVFYGLKRLRHLNLDGNRLKSLKYNSLPKGLKYVDLSKNSIVNVPSEVISSLTNLNKINLGGNPINCSCSLMNLQDWLSGRGVVFEDNVICDLPQEYAGVSWSQVDENRLCLTEARQDEISHSAVYGKLLKMKFHSKKPFENENSYSEENYQSDQPLHPDTQAEVLFQNDDTIAMGEMMRDEEIVNNPDVKQELQVSKEIEKGNQPDVNTEATSSEGETNSESTDVTESHNNPDIKKINEDKTNHEQEDHSKVTLKDDGHENRNSELKQILGESPEPTDNSNKEAVDNTNDIMSDGSTTQTMDEEHERENENGVADSSQTDNLNGNNTVEFNHLNEDDQTETDDLKKEGFLTGGDAEIKMPNENDTVEEDTTDIPQPEDTTTDEVISTEETPTAIGVSEEHQETETTEGGSSTSTSTPGSIIDTEPENKTLEVIESVPPPVDVSDTFATPNSTQNITASVLESGEGAGNQLTKLPGDPENKSLKDSKAAVDQRVKEVQGAEVLMFCVGVLVICLILYSVYKCRRSSNKRPITRSAKDLESNRGTEMQDMASLIPKSQEDDKKNHLKYPDKGTSSENVKLISEQNGNASPDKKVLLNDNHNTKPKADDKNSLNNNSSSPTIKTPLLKPETPVTINPAAPIQRTRAKVGIIPDSIPRTPIFLQKTYNNGTKHV